MLQGWLDWREALEQHHPQFSLINLLEFLAICNAKEDLSMIRRFAWLMLNVETVATPILYSTD
jgi:hypothetical protein